MIKNLVVLFFILLMLNGKLSFAKQKKYCIQLAVARYKKTVINISRIFASESNLKVKRTGKFYTVFLGPYEGFNAAKNQFLKLKPKFKSCCSDAFIKVCSNADIANNKKNQTGKNKENKNSFCIQLISTDKPKTISRIKLLFSNNNKLKIVKIGNHYTALLGEFKTFQEAENELVKLESTLQKCCPGSFIRTCNKLKRNSYKRKKVKSENQKIKISIKKMASISNSYSLLLEKAKVCMSKKDCNMAIKYLIQATTINPSDPKTYIYLGYAYLHLGKREKALDAFSKALAINPFYPEGYASLGYLYFISGKPEVASIFFEKAYKMKPNNLYYAVNYAISLEESGKLKKAEAMFKELKNKFPFVPEIYFNEASLYLKENKWQKALKDFKIFISLTEGIEHYNYYVSRAKLISKQLERIIKDGKTGR